MTGLVVNCNEVKNAITKESAYMGTNYTEGVDGFIGLVHPAHQAVVDTGAQHGVIGKFALERLERELAKHGLKVKRVPLQLDGATGIGGGCDFIETVVAPTGLGGIPGLLSLIHI